MCSSDLQITSKKGETTGDILISTSLDRAETAILAASLETIDRVGPCVAHVTVESIEDIRVSKRKKIVERAKEILIERFDDGAIDSDELLDDVRQTIRVEKIGTIGEEKLPAGPMCWSPTPSSSSKGGQTCSTFSGSASRMPLP